MIGNVLAARLDNYIYCTEGAQATLTGFNGLLLTEKVGGGITRYIIAQSASDVCVVNKRV